MARHSTACICNKLLQDGLSLLFMKVINQLATKYICSNQSGWAVTNRRFCFCFQPHEKPCKEHVANKDSASQTMKPFTYIRHNFVQLYGTKYEGGPETNDGFHNANECGEKKGFTCETATRQYAYMNIIPSHSISSSTLEVHTYLLFFHIYFRLP